MKFLAFLLTLIMLDVRAQQQDVQIDPVKVSDNIYMLKGRGGNVGVSFGNDGVLIIDNQFENMVPGIKEAIGKLTNAEIRYIINTHFHGDHTGGNEIFGEEKKTILAHENVYKRMSREHLNTYYNQTTPASPKAALPIITFDHFIKLHLNDDVVHVMNFDQAHTDGDAVVYFEKNNVIHMGDLYVEYGFPFIDSDAGGSINGFIKSLDKVLILINDDTKVIPGHGELATKKDVQKFRNDLSLMKDILVKEISAGKDLSSLISTRPLASYEEEWGKGFIKAKDFITLIYPELSKK